MLPNRFSLSVGQESAGLSVDFIGYYALSKDRYDNASTAEKGGLSAFPSEPGSQTYTGSELTSFVSSFTINGVDQTSIFRNANINGNLSRAYRMDKFGTSGAEYFPADPYEMMPEWLVDVTFHSCDAASLTTLLKKVANREAVDASLVIGNTAGGINTIALNNLIIPDGDDEPVHEDGDDRKTVTIRGLRCQATNTSSRDEISWVCT
jgi:hypothetical protein